MVTWAPFEISVNIVCLIGLKNTLCDPKRLSHYLFPLYLSTTIPFFLYKILLKNEKNFAPADKEIEN